MKRHPRHACPNPYYSPILVLSTSKREHITPDLFQLHWVPLSFQIVAKYSVSHIQNTEWNSTTVSQRTDPKSIPVRLFRSESCSRLTVLQSQTAMHGDKSFRA